MNRMRVWRAASAAAVGVCVAGGAIAGPITPPPGPVASTGKTIAEVEPRIAINLTNTPGDANSVFKITARGSYYLSENVAGASGKHGIEITASNVTLDLNGFSLVGGSGSLDGVNIATSRGVNIRVHNGMIQSWGGSGLKMEYNAGNPPQGSIVGIHANNNGADGIVVEFNSEVIDCVATDNVGDGIKGGSIAQITGCQASSNGGDGIYSGQMSVVTECRATGNDGTGFALALGSVISDSVAAGNAVGITGQGCVIRSCIAHTNAGNGIDSFEGCTILDCAAYRNGGDGIEGSTATVVSRCSATDNDANGIVVSSGSTVQECVARLNGLNGIQVAGASLILGNQCSSNGQDPAGGAGILVSSTDSKIEGNNCTSQDIGIKVSSSGSIIVRNTCSGNTLQWDIAASNYYGPIINRVGVVTAAVNGTSASSTLGSTDSNANFTY